MPKYEVVNYNKKKDSTNKRLSSLEYKVNELTRMLKGFLGV